MHRDVVLEGVLTQDLEQLRLLSEGRAVTASGQQMARIAAKGWLDTVDGVHHHLDGAHAAREAALQSRLNQREEVNGLPSGKVKKSCPVNRQLISLWQSIVIQMFLDLQSGSPSV